MTLETSLCLWHESIQNCRISWPVICGKWYPQYILWLSCLKHHGWVNTGYVMTGCFFHPSIGYDRLCICADDAPTLEPDPTQVSTVRGTRGHHGIVCPSWHWRSGSLLRGICGEIHVSGLTSLQAMDQCLGPCAPRPSGCTGAWQELVITIYLKLPGGAASGKQPVEEHILKPVQKVSDADAELFRKAYEVGSLIGKSASVSKHVISHSGDPPRNSWFISPYRWLFFVDNP